VQPGAHGARPFGEKALEGQHEGSNVVVSVPPADGYGLHDNALIQRVPKRSLQGSGEIKKGMQFQGRTDDGMRLFTVTGVMGDMVTLDGNHPLADKTLNFDVQIVTVREATAEELEHGHVHGAGGHHH
jgi:FKBP-type peptidyl-prolyl cis-trans isomerase SlyD